MSDEKRMIGDYEVKESIWFGGKEYIMGEDKSGKAEMPYITCVGTRNELFANYDNALISDDYMELFNVFTERLNEQAKQITAERAERGVTATPLTTADCVKGGLNENIEGKIIILKTSSLSPEFRTADNQIMIATGGNGCNPDGHGRAVYCKNLYSGDKSRFERYDVAGIADIAKLPEWAKQKIAELEKVEKTGQKPSILTTIEEKKKEISQQDAAKPPQTEKKKNNQEL